MPQINNKSAAQQFVEIVIYRNKHKGNFVTTTHTYNRDEFNIEILGMIFRNFTEFTVSTNPETGVTKITI